MELDDGSEKLRLCLLGRVRLWRGTVELPVGPPQRRAVLGLLAPAEGQPVGRDELVDALWPTGAPRSGANVIHTHVKYLRRVLEPGRPLRMASQLLPSVGTGYRLVVDPIAIDVLQFRRLVAEARTARARADQARVWELAGEALRLWQPPLADVPVLAGHPRTAPLIAEAQFAFSWRVDAAIRLGRAEEVLGVVREWAEARPLDEQAQAHLMRCYIALGRRSDAFAVFDTARKRLVAELGADPGAVLADAHQELLESDSSAGVPCGPVERSPNAVGGSASAAMPPVVVPAQLPPDTAAFTGRVAQLRWLDELITAEKEGGPTVVALTGTAGVGKTTLAVHWGHQIAERFPDGQLYADLAGFDASADPVRPDEVVREFLDAFGVAPERVPVSPTAQIGLYRSLLARRRVLILLDNARRADQVRPLLPGSADCLVIVTSRNELSGLVASGARPLSLGLMTDVDARQMLVDRIGPERVAAEPDAVGQIIATCARLPLALAIVAARASTQPAFPLNALVGELREGSGDLAVLSDDEAAFDVRTVFSWSYRLLSTEAATLFRLIGLHPGPELSANAAAALVGLPLDRVRPLLAQLARAHLLVEHRPVRFGCHDLLRAYAAELARTVEPERVRRAVLRRILDHYLDVAAIADRLISPYRHAGSVPARLPAALDDVPAAQRAGAEQPGDAEAAFGWFSTEHPVLLALIDQAATAGLDREVCELAWYLCSYFDRRAYRHDQATVQRTALSAAGRLGDRLLEARARRELARAYLRLGLHDDARRELQQVLRWYEELGDDAGRANTEMSLADSCERQGRYRDALAHAKRALVLYRAVGYRPGRANALNAIGWCHSLLGDHPAALTYCARALRQHQLIGDHRAAADTWDSIGRANHGLGRYRPAVRCFQQAILLFQKVGDRLGEAVSLTRLGDTREMAGDLRAARADWSRSLAILTELDHPRAAEVQARLTRSPLARA
ncbi:tetratricopeptide repeat protein [Plantactinospora sp. S1510]|uniref:Tetratricopeptide repeat protein n=1 Tax=Plantactinospora alkalitolerans TaxID=2789879 RepID=A0ABS0GVK3_9ACTN|nr:BTAD domain-containing putative transcriptional regulator [Plantactinospora alkalitolerans]MBF9130237.1 tetratricopeptide repeat protein [Plantactinospora alkalitolerans]